MTESKHDPTLVAASRVDLTRARPSCRRCHGTGVVSHLHRDGARIPVVCRCVVRNDGIVEAGPSYDDYLAATQGDAADKILQAALRLPPALWPKCARALDAMINDMPFEDRNGARALAFTAARRVLVQRIVERLGAAAADQALAPTDGQPNISTDDAPAGAREEEP